MMRHDITFPLYVEVDEIYNLACPASPIHYQFDPVQTTKTNVHGAINVLELAADHDSEEILALIEAIQHLEEQDAQLGRIVRLRFYAGLSVEETAAALGLSERTVKRRWRLARVWRGPRRPMRRTPQRAPR